MDDLCSVMKLLVSFVVLKIHLRLFSSQNEEFADRRKHQQFGGLTYLVVVVVVVVCVGDVVEKRSSVQVYSGLCFARSMDE